MLRKPVGRVAGRVSARKPSGSAFEPSGKGWDFAIGGLPFHAAIKDERVYERATAEFRKQQIDQGETVGDQSLQGWWTRGQLSFHKGGGVKFLDPLAGETVLDRFKASDSIVPWERGEVSLRPELPTVGLTDVRDVVPAVHSGVAGVVAITAGGGLQFATSSPGATFTPSPAGTVNGITTDGRLFYAAVGDRIQVQVVGSTTLNTLWTHTGGAELERVWFAKGRLWVVDENGRWYTLPRTGGTFADVNAWWQSGITGATWSLTDSPAAVYISESINIYGVTVDQDGSVPVLSAPAVAAQMPVTEEVGLLTYYLGAMVICTNAGVRVAITGNGEAIYGPHIIEGDFSGARRAATRGAEVLFTGTHEDDTGACLYSINLTEAISDLEFAWCKWAQLGTISTGLHGAVLTDAGVVGWSHGTSSSLKREGTNLASSGTLYTGLHRFGTLEPKKFESLRVKVGGAGGTITASRVMRDESEVNLYTFDVTLTDNEEITLGLSSVEEFIGLKFTFARSATDATKGPELLGYQLRAMPAPRRQRLIRVPLSLFDVERGSAAQLKGRLGGAWDRLRRLEAMEEQGGTLIFQDFRIKESALVFIEKIEMANATPPTQQGSGFGGVVWVTMRKVG